MNEKDIHATHIDIVSETKQHKAKNNKKDRKNNDLLRDNLVSNNNSSLINVDNMKSYNKKKDKSYINKLKEDSNINTLSSMYKDISFQKNGVSNSIQKNIYIDSPLSIHQLSEKIFIPEAQIITYLFLQGISVTINEIIDKSIIKQVALNYNVNILDKPISTNTESSIPTHASYNTNVNKEKRAPIITILGHVDHGKTTLLDSILKTNLVNQEEGGITQTISGHEIKWLYDSKLHKLVFLDTPGHEAFTSMRARGAKVTDIVLLVVAADDGLKPQTIEAIQYIKKINILCIVVINKVDKNSANIGKVREELMEYNIVDKDLGGDTFITEVSALTGFNINMLLSNICLLSKLQNFTAGSNDIARGTILESYLDKKRGIISHMIVQNGTLKIGDIVISGKTYGKVKKIVDFANKNIKQAGPSSIINCLCFSSLPQAGSPFYVVSNGKEARMSINTMSDQSDFLDTNLKLLNNRKFIDHNYKIKYLNLVIKSDTQGSLEAITYSFAKIEQKKVQLNIITASTNSISSTDIDLCISTNSLIIGFNISVTPQILTIIKQHSLNLQLFTVIYDLLDYVRNCMLDLVEPEYEKQLIGSAKVQTIFEINQGFVAGCIVNQGIVKKKSHIAVLRNNNIVYEGILTSLKRLKNDVDEIIAPHECGIMCEYNSWEQSDIIKVYDLISKDKTLS
uniref:Translation initiation factor IF-2, chloroplastic n=1 Tax=Nitophyllum punctatum TaxID=158729 RepID=A0A4D6WV69_9FLOR|nr:Translation initiation factor 2 [Nitophyllum punctatum]